MTRRTSLLGGGSASAIRTLCQRSLSSVPFRHALRAPLRRLLEFDAYCLNTCDVHTGVITSSVGDGLSPEHSRALFALEAEGNDFNGLHELYRGPKRVASLWQSTAGAPERSPRMRQIFLPLGFNDELRAALTVGGACFGYLHLFRRPTRGPFQTADLKRLERVTPLIAVALRSAAAFDAERSADGGASYPALLMLDAHNRLIGHSNDAPAAVANLDSLRIASGSAHVLQDLASRARRGGAARATLLRESIGPRRASALQLGDQTAIIVDHLNADDTRTLLTTLAGLTPRERKVSAYIARGYTNLAIAAELGIALHTVKDHVKAVLGKTQCASRAELAARWSGAHP
ncbi:MAG: helix-turn-helix transcriptional regulator [Polyangiaceae bacterium]